MGSLDFLKPVTQALTPIANAVTPFAQFIPGAGQIIKGIDLGLNAVNAIDGGNQPSGGGGSSSGGGGLGGILRNPYVQQGLTAAEVMAAQNQASKNAQALQDNAYNRIGAATKQATDTYEGYLQKYKNPALSGLWQPSFAPSNLSPLRAASVGSVGGYSVDGAHASPQPAYSSPPSYPTGPFAQYAGSFSAFPGMGAATPQVATSAVPAGQPQPATPPVPSPTPPTGNTHAFTPPVPSDDGGRGNPFGFYGGNFRQRMMA